MKNKNAMMATSASLVGLFLLASEFFLAVRFVLHFFAVNPANGFAAWVFNSTNSLMTPFRGVFTGGVAGHPHYVDLQTLFVMAAYAIAAGLLVWLLAWSDTERLDRKR
jgi:YGGT family